MQLEKNSIDPEKTYPRQLNLNFSGTTDHSDFTYTGLKWEAPDWQPGLRIKEQEKSLETFQGIGKYQEHKGDQNKPESEGGQKTNHAEFGDQANHADNDRYPEHVLCWGSQFHVILL